MAFEIDVIEYEQINDLTWPVPGDRLRHFIWINVIPIARETKKNISGG